MAANGGEREKSPLLASAGLAPTLRASIFLCELPFSLREPGPLLATQSPCSPFYLFFAGFPGLQGPAGLPGAPGLSLPSVIAGQPGDPGRPGLDGEQGKVRKPKEGWPSPLSGVWGGPVYSPAPSPLLDLHGPVRPHVPPPAGAQGVGMGCILLKGFGKVWALGPHRRQGNIICPGNSLWLPISPKAFSNGRFLFPLPSSLFRSYP